MNSSSKFQFQMFINSILIVAVYRNNYIDLYCEILLNPLNCSSLLVDSNRFYTLRVMLSVNLVLLFPFQSTETCFFFLFLALLHWLESLAQD